MLCLEIGPHQVFFTNSLQNKVNSGDDHSVSGEGYVVHQGADLSLAHLISVMSGHSLELASHGSRVAHFSAAIAREIGQSAAEISLVRRAGFLHDIGKVLIPWQIYNGANILSERERREMEQHPFVGEGLCATFSALKPLLPIIRHHHERLDGTGFPDGLAGDDIPLGAQIVAVADYYDSITSDRYYRRSASRKQAAAIISQACNSNLNSQLVEALLWALESERTEPEPFFLNPMVFEKEHAV